jgi:hypothetical protein
MEDVSGAIIAVMASRLRDALPILSKAGNANISQRMFNHLH